MTARSQRICRTFSTLLTPETTGAISAGALPQINEEHVTLVIKGF